MLPLTFLLTLFSLHLQQEFSRVEFLPLVLCIFSLFRSCQIVLRSGCTCISMSSHRSVTQPALGTLRLRDSRSFDGGKQCLILALNCILSPDDQ